MLEKYMAAIDEIVDSVENNPIDPAEFQRCWLPDIDLSGDRSLCDREFAKLLRVTESTVRDWGPAPRYPQMPKRHLRHLTHCHVRLAYKYPDLVPDVVD
jgi:hypothetical protein